MDGFSDVDLCEDHTEIAKSAMATQPFGQQNEKADFNPAALTIYALPMYENQKPFEFST